jgi:uncharacterized protein YdbL (DUF1318 family)
MKKKSRILKQFLIAALLVACASAAFSAGEKERMLQRLPELQALKDSGVIGEQSDGLLGFVKSSPADESLVAAENKDRLAVYAEIAGKQGVAASTVAQRRALQIVEQASRGDWLRDASGKWVQKK